MTWQGWWLALSWVKSKWACSYLRACMMWYAFLAGQWLQSVKKQKTFQWCLFMLGTSSVWVHANPFFFQSKGYWFCSLLLHKEIVWAPAHPEAQSSALKSSKICNRIVITLWSRSCQQWLREPAQCYQNGTLANCKWKSCCKILASGSAHHWGPLHQF